MGLFSVKREPKREIRTETYVQEFDKEPKGRKSLFGVFGKKKDEPEKIEDIGEIKEDGAGENDL